MSNLYLIHHELDLHISRNRDRVGDNYSLQNKTKPTNFPGRSRIRLGCKDCYWPAAVTARVQSSGWRTPGETAKAGVEWVRSGVRSQDFTWTNLDFAWKSSIRLINEVIICSEWSHFCERQWKWLTVSIYKRTKKVLQHTSSLFVPFTTCSSWQVGVLSYLNTA